MLNSNASLDITGIIIVALGMLICFVFCLRTHVIIEDIYKCDNDIIKMREQRINGAVKTIVLNFLCLLFFDAVLIEWFVMKMDTAASMIDIQVLLLECSITALLVRSSDCSFRGIKALARIRQADKHDCEKYEKI